MASSAPQGSVQEERISVQAGVDSSKATDKDEMDKFYSELSELEMAWRDRQPFLESKGYMLRPRYRPGWVPSWRGTSKFPIHCEDAILLPLREHLIDAMPVSGGNMVYVKRVKTNDTESTIAVMLSSGDSASDPRNHSVPILDHFQDDEDPTISYIVMPFLQLIDSPPFETVGDVLSFCDQVLEGLVFLHEQGVAHRDCSYKNIMMDANALYPEGFHPVKPHVAADGVTWIEPLSRSSSQVKYYYIDFGISVIIPHNAESRMVTGNFGRDREPPELEFEDKPYDPFKLDVFILGNVLRREFHDKFKNIDILVPLIESMVKNDPAQRPDAAAAHLQWQGIAKGLRGRHRKRKLRERGSSWVPTLLASIGNFFSRVVNYPRVFLSGPGQKNPPST